MKRLSVAVLLIVVTGTAFAAPRGPHHPQGYAGAEVPPYVEEELQTLFTENAATAIGSLTAADVQAVLERLSVAAQKAAFVERSKTMSFMLPGLGQMVNKDYTSGTLYLLADIAVATGTVLGAYYLLPAPLRFDRLDYFNTSYGGIRDAWEGQSFMDYLPSMAVLAGGGLAMAILGGISSEHAGRLAERNIAEGKITFQPKLLAGFLPGPAGAPCDGPKSSWGMGWGMRMGY